MHIDPMEEGRGGKHPPGKVERVTAALRELGELGVVIGTHKQFGDVVAEHDQGPLRLIEVEGESSKQREQAVYSALGQLLMSMKLWSDNVGYGIAVPDTREWVQQVQKIPPEVTTRLHLWRYLVGLNFSVTSIEPGEAMPDWGGVDEERSMRMTSLQRVIVVVTAAAVVLQLLFPPTYRDRPDLPATALRVLAIIIAGGTIFWLNPTRKFLVPAAVVMGLGAVAVGSVVLWHTFAPPSPSWKDAPLPALPPWATPIPSPTVQAPPPPSRPTVKAPPPPPTLSAVADSNIVQAASRILNFQVDTMRETFEQLHAEDKDTLCEAGKAIRDSMKAHRNTVADLNHVVRAIYDITAPAGRCH